MQFMMASTWYIVKSMLLLAIILEVKTQIFDIFQGFQPLIKPYPTAPTTHRKQFQFIYTPTDKTTNNDRRDDNSDHSFQDFGNIFLGQNTHKQFPNNHEVNRKATSHTSTTTKPPKRYSSQNHSNKNENNVKNNNNDFYNTDNNKKRKPMNEESSNRFESDTYFAIRPLYKTTKAPQLNVNEESGSNFNNNNYYDNDYTMSNQKPNHNQRPHDDSYTTKRSNNIDRTDFNSYTTAKPAYDRTNNNKYTTEKSTYNNDRTNHNRYPTAKPVRSNDGTNTDTYTTAKPAYNDDRINYNSYTNEKPAYNNDRTNNNKHTTVKPTFNDDRTKYNSYTTPKPAINNDRTNYNNEKTSHKTSTSKPKQNHRTEDIGRPNFYDQPNFNSYTTSSTPKYNTERPDYDRPYHNNGRPNTNNERPNHNNNGRPNYNTYTTENPFLYRPGVKPAVTRGPPITNRPVTQKPYHFGTEDAILFPEDPDSPPEIVLGPDIDRVSETQRRRYIEMTERMCDRYKSLDMSQVAAIPLLPAPEPVTFNVSDCNPMSTPLIVGGKVVNIEQFPHNAAIGWQKMEGGGYSWKCGGSLISELFVLTAAHCSFQERDNTVVLGPPRVVQLGSSYLGDPGALVVKVTKAIRHPRYKLPSSYYDIALLKLAASVKFSEVIKPACLGVPPRVGDSIIATGWGRTEFGGEASTELRGVSVPVWDMRECSRVLGTSRKLPDGPSAESQVCAGEVQGGKDTCQGDSGGPAQIQDGCAWRVVGVTSLGRACGAPKTPAVYATTPREFIAAVLDSYK